MKKYLLTIIFSLVCMNLFCQTTETKEDSTCFTIIDSCVVHSLGKKNAQILLYADSIVARTIAWEGCKEESIILTESMAEIVKYTFCTPSMYISNKKVYASFQPYLTLTFYKENISLSIQFDYGINKWMINNDNDVVICRDLKNSALLPLFYILFRNNQLIENSYKRILQ